LEEKKKKSDPARRKGTVSSSPQNRAGAPRSASPLKNPIPREEKKKKTPTPGVVEVLVRPVEKKSRRREEGNFTNGKKGREGPSYQREKRGERTEGRVERRKEVLNRKAGIAFIPSAL